MTSSHLQNLKMTDSEFRELSLIVNSETGIKMPPAKKSMLLSRLIKRLRILEMKSFSEYIEFLKTPKGQKDELVVFIDSVTTNKTDFLREPKHFDILTNQIVPDMIRRFEVGFRKKFRIWSAPCSTGEEPYTMAMYLSEFASTNRGFSFSVLATDISTEVLKKAALAVYDHERVEVLDIEMRRKYLMRGKDKYSDSVRINPLIRSLVHFKRINFMDEHYDTEGPVDVIFCRNVLIYFEKAVQEKVINRLCRCLVPGGYLFTGHSENLNGLDVPLINVGSTVYRKKESIR